MSERYWRVTRPAPLCHELRPEYGPYADCCFRVYECWPENFDATCDALSPDDEDASLLVLRFPMTRELMVRIPYQVPWKQNTELPIDVWLKVLARNLVKPLLRRGLISVDYQDYRHVLRSGGRITAMRYTVSKVETAERVLRELRAQAPLNRKAGSLLMHVEVPEARCNMQTFDALVSAFSAGLDEAQVCLASISSSEKDFIHMTIMRVSGRCNHEGRGAFLQQA